jgi:hypothetical protein
MLFSCGFGFVVIFLSDFPLINWQVITRDKWDAWLNLVERLLNVNLVDEPDRFSWRVTSSGVFSVKSMHAYLINEHARFLLKFLWKLKV